MLRTQIAAAIGCARGHALDEIMREVWTRYSAGQLSEEDAGQLSTLAQERRAAWRGSAQAGLGLVMPPPPERCPTPVRRRSHFKGRSEGQIWRPTTRREMVTLMDAAYRYDEQKGPGERNGPLGPVALQVLRYFVNLVDFKTGRLEPSIETIMGKIRRSRDAVVRALKNLRAHGFLDWLRRYEPTGNEGGGPQVQQASNAYRLSLPEKARQLLGRFGKTPPPPDDHGQEQKIWTDAIAAYRASLPMEDRMRMDSDNPALTEALIKLGKSVNKRESAIRTESLSDLYLSMKT